MKKCFIIVLVLLFMCGCDKTKPEYLVSSIGFDKTGEEYNVCFETVIINTENTKQTLKVIKGKGKDIETAVSEIYRQSTQPILLSHSGVIILGDGIDKADYKEICDYCKSQDITLSAFFVKAKNPEKLLGAKPISSVCVGYDIMGLIKQNKVYKNRMFEIINANFKVELPFISLEEGGLIFENV